MFKHFVYQLVPIDNLTHVPGPVAQYSAESVYNTLCTEIMALVHLIMPNKELMIKDTDVVP